MAICKAMDLAHYIVDKSTRDDKPVSNLQLQKMMYFIQYTHCKYYGEPLFDDEEFQAWQYGPVVPSVYDEYSSYGGRAITELYEGVDRKTLFGRLADWVDSGIRVLRKYSPWDLVSVAHAKGSPWYQIWNNGAGRYDTIPNSLILESAVAS